jgi:hypothetical protein
VYLELNKTKIRAAEIKKNLMTEEKSGKSKEKHSIMNHAKTARDLNNLGMPLIKIGHT